jgi:ABC-type sugar transport system permease subunit
MPHRTFFMFVLPSLFVMVLFIALPILSVAYQSLFIEHEQQMTEVETCDPFSCTKELRVDAEAMQALRDAAPMGKFNGLGTYVNSSHLAFAEVGQLWQTTPSMGAFFSGLMNLPLYKSLAFTLSYTFIVTPLVIISGFFIALGVNAIPGLIKGPVIFFSLLPMIVTPLIGSLVLFWMIDSNGILGASLQRLMGDPGLTLKASPTLTWTVLMVYGVWHSAPFSFIVFYAGLQGVPKDTLESAMIDGASRWERVRYVVIPHLIPLTTFIALMQLMDNFRVLEPIVGFSAEANATSLSFLIYNDLRGAETPLYGSAGATSMLTILGVVILLMPVLIRTSREFNRKSH